MKIAELLDVVDKGWVQKPQGFRVHFQQKTDQEIITDYVPGTDDAPLDSDVVAWRIAWKLYQSTQSDHPDFGQGKLINIYVVDDAGNPVKYYANNRYKVFNSKDTKT
jgi:hypothetical protein